MNLKPIEMKTVQKDRSGGSLGMTNKSVARSLKETAALIELTGGNPFRSRALSNAARTIERLQDSVQALIEIGTLTDIRGIGAGLRDQIAELLARGTFTLRDDLLGSIPPGLLDILEIKGLGAKKVRELWKELGIQTIEELEVAAGSGRIAEISGFGEKTQKSILVNIAALYSYRSRRHFATAWTQTSLLVAELRDLPGVDRLEPAGELRRMFETVGQVDLVLATVDGSVPAKLLALTDGVEGTPEENSSEYITRTCRGSIADGLPLIISVCRTDSFGSVLFALSGSTEFLNEWSALYGDTPRSSEETEIFRQAGSAFIEPEIREHESIVEDARSGPLARLLEESDLKGSLHNHSTYSDGAHTLRQMSEMARSMGLSYFGICDHSQSLKIAYGMSIAEVARQQVEIHLLNEEFAADGGPDFRIFSGIESDILDDGSLDYPDDILESFDFVVASVHTGFNMTVQEATERVCTAVSNPYTSILGHPTGRLLLRREGYPLDHESVLDACARHGVAVELNANPYRLDLDWRWIEAARERDLMISINPDAHAMDQLLYQRWGVCVARKGQLTADGCLNALGLPAFSQWIREKDRRGVITVSTGEEN